MIAIRSWNPWLDGKPSVNLLYPRLAELAELNLRNSGSSSAWCSAHNVSAAAGRMFEDPEFLRFSSAGSLGVWNNNQVGEFVNSWSLSCGHFGNLRY
ncbi:MAG: hypothetical protein IPK68_17780 [Bdellovibrionales bacterium]|nr:hypothetical protein [Bdellovibrionales bacterium]